MKTEIVPLVQELECYICGSKNVEALCHHCGRAMCDNHKKEFYVPDSQFYNSVHNDEFTGLTLPETVEGETAVHCEDCLHYIVTYERSFYIMGAVGLVLILTALMTPTLGAAIVHVLGGLAVIAISIWGILTEQDFRSFKMRTACFDLPFWGRFPSATLRETAVGKVTLESSGVYQVTAEKSSGVFSFGLSLTEADEMRLSQYRQKHRLENSENIAFHAGFAVLQGTDRLQPASLSRLTSEINPIKLIGRAASLPFLDSLSHGRQWQYQQAYNFTLDNQYTAGLPLQIIPSLISEGDEWGIELDIQITPYLDTSLLSNPVIRQLELEALGFNGTVENFIPSAETWTTGQNRPKISWQNIPFHLTSSKSFYLRFANSRNIRPDFKVRGKLIAKFEGALSAIINVVLFSPLGENLKMRDTDVHQTSEVEIQFHFDLATLCLREFHPKTQPIEQLTAIPGNEMITRLVNAMSDKGLYVQRVIENPAQMNRANAQIMNRLWVIAGRRYQKATPIDFRVVAVGQEYYENSDKPYDGKTQFEITTQGTVIRQDMRVQVDKLCSDIVDVIQCTPDLEVTLAESELFVNEWCNLIGMVKNSGKAPAAEISISLEGIKIDRASNIRNLQPGCDSPFRLSVYAEKTGDVPVLTVATYKDEFGPLPPQKKRHLLHVKEKPKPSSFGQQTNFYGPSSGPIHTGGGNIGSDDTG